MIKYEFSRLEFAGQYYTDLTKLILKEFLTVTANQYFPHEHIDARVVLWNSSKFDTENNQLAIIFSLSLKVSLLETNESTFCFNNKALAQQ
jgi:hypothetical protein